MTRVERYNPYSIFVVAAAAVAAAATAAAVAVVVVVGGGCCLCVCLLLLLLLLGGGVNPHVKVFVVDASHFCTIMLISYSCIPEYRPIRYFSGFRFRDIFQL